MRIVLIGAGNLATSLSFALMHSHHEILQIYSRTIESADTLATKLIDKYGGNISTTADIASVVSDADIYIISIKDSALHDVALQLKDGREDSLFVHTAGSMHIDTLESRRRAVLYPMQTFSRSRVVDFSDIPCFVEASSADDLELVESLARSMSNNVIRLTSEDRKWLHIAAVFCCNFANHCSALAAEVLESHNIPFTVMLPLIDETTRKLHSMSPADAQTGPAVRWDENVIGRHLDILSDDANKQEIYKLMSESIREMHNS